MFIKECSCGENLTECNSKDMGEMSYRGTTLSLASCPSCRTTFTKKKVVIGLTKEEEAQLDVEEALRDFMDNIFEPAA